MGESCCAFSSFIVVPKCFDTIMMMAMPSIRYLLLSCILSSTSAHSLSRDDTHHGFPQLRVRNETGLAPFSVNGTLTNSTRAVVVPQIPLACNFTQEATFKAIEANCSAYIDVLESTSIFPQWERWQSSERFSNCTFHEIATLFADVPDGLSELAFREGKFVFIAQPNMTDGRRYKPLPPLELAKKVEGGARFLPILQESTKPFFRRYRETARCPDPARNTTLESDSQTQGDPSLVLQSIEIATHQYSRCALQKAGSPDKVQSCTVSTTAKLSTLPHSFFIYFGASACDAKLFSYLGVALSILLDVLQMCALMWLGLDSISSFSWLQFLVKLAAGIGEPAIQAVLLQRANGETASGFVIAAMEFLQPSAAPIVAFVAGWWFSKGHAFQTLATDAVTTMAGVAMVLGFTTMRIAGMAFTASDEMSMLVPVGLLCAVGPWVVVYLLFGLVGLPMQLCFIFGMIEMWLCKSAHLIGYAMFFLGILVVALTFVAFTPIWALWELGWAARQKMRKYKGLLVKDEKGEQPLFPLARYFRDRFQNTSRFKRGCVKLVFWLFILMSMTSFVGKWMFMVNVLNFAGDAYCPSGYKEATFAGLAFKAVVLGAGVGLQFFGLTA
ncbi:hypothetical protein QBC39DRAFT_353001 [Podospora conica]|nr:hypothetical protein QBC39DRAFT_353001 [Schizothecium conicum]